MKVREATADRTCKCGDDFTDVKTLPDKCKACKYVANPISWIPDGWRLSADTPRVTYRVLLDGVVIETSSRPWL